MKKNLTPEAVVAGFEQRVDAMFRAESGKPLVRAKKQKPLDPGRGNYVRAYSYSMVGFAARCLYLNEMLEEANAALAENAQHYLDNPLDINDRDSFHWHAEIVMRLIEMYGTDGSNRITKKTEALALKPIWEYVRKVSRLDKAEYEKSKTWHIYLSENHHAMSFTVCWQFAKIAKDRPEYKDLKYDDGATAAEHYRAWNAYFVVYCRERARKSLCIEMMCDDYNSTLIKGFYNFYDFGDPQVRRSAGLLLDLYFPYWAQEQIDGVQGGGRSRIYFWKGLKQNREHGNAPLAWFYFGIGKQPAVYGHDMNAALSDYRPPAVVADIAIDVAGRGRYEVRQRPQGLGKTGRPLKIAATKVPTRMRTDGGGILRYSYCDPAFIMGTPMTEARPLEDWAAISAQNRWQGVIFAGEHDARIVPIVRPKDNRVAMNAQWSVQSKGSLITQKLKHHKDGAEMIIWMSKSGLSTPVEENGVVYVEAKGAYAAVRVGTGGFKWMDGEFETDRFVPENATMIPNDEYAPVIVEVMAKSDVTSFDAFKKKVKACEVHMDRTVLRYKTIYGDQLTFDTSTKAVPSINGKPVDYAPKKVFESPFLNAEWNSGVVTISKGTRKKILDFTKQVEDNPDRFLYTRHYSDLPWSSILEEKQIPIGTNSYAGITGSIIDVNNEVVEKGPHAFRPIESEINIHTLGNSLIPRRDFHKWSRWYQEDGNTQVFRLFDGEHNVRNARANAARIEAFSKKRWNRGTWHEWIGTYTIVKAQGCAIFQVKNNGEDWSIQLVMTADGDVIFQPRRATSKTVLKNMEGKSFDVRIRDNGHTSECYINEEFVGRHGWERPSGRSAFRWGMYVGGKKLSKDALLFVTGATVDPERNATEK